MSARQRYEYLTEQFLREQESVLGKRAWKLASGVDGLTVAEPGAVHIEGDARATIGRLSDEFRAMVGGNVEEAFWAASHSLDRAVEIPPALAVDTELSGYTEGRNGESWTAIDELDSVERQPGIWARLFGLGSADSDESAEPIAPRRGVPMDASDEVYEAWLEQKEAENGFKTATGHTWVTADEIPDPLLADASTDLVQSLRATSHRRSPERARLIVWKEYVIEN